MRELLRAITSIGPFIVQIILGRKSKKTDMETVKEEK